MSSVAISAVEAENMTKLFTDVKPAKLSPLVICGACGAEEQVVDDNKTECPNCDECIY